MKKQILTSVLAVMLAAALVGCGAKSEQEVAAAQTETESTAATESATVVESTEAENTEAESAEAESTEAEGSENADAADAKTKNVLVVYYSATGSTKKAAEKMAELTGGALFELKPVEEYTSEDLNYNDPQSRVCKEHDNADLQEIQLAQVTPEEFENADTILLGYPIWWGGPAWPVDGFVKENDFTGKTVIPFCTSASSGLGSSDKTLAEMAGTGEWQAGKRFSSNASEVEIKDWVDSLGLGEK